MLGVVLAACAVQLFIQAGSFRFDHHRDTMRAYGEWQRNPTPTTEAVWNQALAEKQRVEARYRVVACALGVLFLAPAAWLLFRKSRVPDVVTLWGANQ